MSEDAALVLNGKNLKREFKRNTGEIVHALDDVSFMAERGTITALVGPDGAGKTTLIRVACGLISPNSGSLEVLGFDCVREAQAIQDRVGYMPQRFGLYEDLTVQENLDLYADLHGVDKRARDERYPRLMQMTALGPFTKRLAGQLSGGMKQKLGLACSLVRAPELLLLDEPTAGVDPLSRHELWEIIFQLVREEKTTVLIATSYLDEAERCGHVVVMHEGKVLAQGAPEDVTRIADGHVFEVDPPEGQTPRGLQARLLDEDDVIDAVPDNGKVRFVRRNDHAGTAAYAKDARAVAPRFEDGFMMILREHDSRTSAAAPEFEQSSRAMGDVVVEVRDLVRMFGGFTAVDHVNFEVRRGEVFGLLGPNGAGKTTTFRMLCGLLPVTSGTLRIAGLDLRKARASARQHIGYVAQKFSLYGQLSVVENLEFYSAVYGLSGAHRRARIDWALKQFELEPLRELPSAQLPGGFKQRLAMAAALVHEPEILFLDEPTSGADPLARREFWRRITALAEAGANIVITTHFMEEAEYCDRVVILDQGRILAQGKPADIRKLGGNEWRPAAHHGRRLHRHRAAVARQRPQRDEGSRVMNGVRASPRRVIALVRKETFQIVRDPSSIVIGVVMPLLLIVLFGYALSLDVRSVPIAVVLEDPSPAASELAAGFRLSPYFAATIITSMPPAQELMLERKVDGIVRLRSDFARQLAAGHAQVQVLVYGGDANRGRIIEAYAQGAVAEWAAHRVSAGQSVAGGPVALISRLWFNEANDSHYFLVPGLIVMVMTLIGAFLTTMVMAREWERGTLEALFVTPVRTFEILLGKTIPYFALGMLGLVLVILASRFLFGVPLRGSFLVLGGASMLYLLVALGIGLLISSAVKSQLVASQFTMLVTYLPALMLSGFIFDLRSAPAAVTGIASIFPARYFVSIMQTVFLAGDVWSVILPNAAVLIGMVVVLLTLSVRVTRKKLV